MPRIPSSAGAAAVLLMLAVPAAAQSLADVARREAERRKTVASPGKVYTNESLRTEPAAVTPPAARPAVPAAVPPSPASAQPQGTPAAGAGQPQEQPPGPTEAEPAPQPTEETKTEAYWRGRVTATRDALSRSQTFAEALQTRINALSADFVNRDDPAQRDVIAADRQKALAELDRVKQEIQDHQKAITTIQEEARRAGVPAGWIR